MTFLSVYTPTYKRPQALARCKASVAAQTIPTEKSWSRAAVMTILCKEQL